MKEFLISSLTIILIGAVGFAQENSPAKSADAQPAFSESIAYQPFDLEKFRADNKKKNKSNKNSDNNQKSAAVSARSAVNGGAAAGEKAVKIPVSVFYRNGNPAANLTKADFKIFINDAEREIESFEIEPEQPLNVFLILDVSPSISNSVEDVKRFASEVTAVLKPEDKVQIIKFHDDFKALSELTNYRASIEKAINKLNDGTALYDMIASVLQKYINKAEGRKIVVLLSDGVDTTSFRQSYETSLAAAETSDALFFTFYLDTYEENMRTQKLPGNFPFPFPPLGGMRTRPRGMDKIDYEIGKQYLLDLAWLSGGKAFEIKKISALKKADFAGIPTFLKPQYTIGINLPNTITAERRQIRVRVNRPNLKIQTRGSVIFGDLK